jgi:hypothetical protein
LAASPRNPFARYTKGQLLRAQNRCAEAIGDVPLFVELRRAGAAGSESKRP